MELRESRTRYSGGGKGQQGGVLAGNRPGAGEI